MFRIIVTFLVINFVNCELNTNKLNVTIYLESLCPDSQRFISTQLLQSWREIAPYVNIEFIPFGKSWIAGSQFECQHGKYECMGNTLMSCALSASPDQDTQVTFTHCFMQNYILFKDKLHNYLQCFEKNKIDLSTVMNCYNSHHGVSLQLKAGERTAAVQKPLEFVPTIVYKGIFNKDLQKGALVNFKETTCTLIKEIHPNACSNINVKLTPQI